MTVAFIVRENKDVTDALQKRIEKVITNLVVNEWASSFLFTNVGAFDSACYDFVTKLKRVFPSIQRQYICGECFYDESDRERISALYDKYFLPNPEIIISYELRDLAMIEKCDVLVTCCNIEYQLNAKRISCTAIAIMHAWKKQKRIINLFEND